MCAVGGGHFKFSQSLANCLLCCSNDNVFSAAQTSCTFRSAHILLHVNVRNDDVLQKHLITLSSLQIINYLLALLRDYEQVISV